MYIKKILIYKLACSKTRTVKNRYHYKKNSA